MISSYLSSLQRIQEEVVQPDIAVMGLIERNMHDHRTADMIDVAAMKLWSMNSRILSLPRYI
jgi:hypothetical protein